MGAVAALTGLYRGATEGGSWIETTSLGQHNMVLLSLAIHVEDVKTTSRQEHDEDFFSCGMPAALMRSFVECWKA